MVSGHSITTTKSLFMFPFSKGFKIPRPSHNGPTLLNSAYRVNTLWPPPSILHSALRPKWPFQQEPCVPCPLSGRGWGTSDCSFLLPPSLHTPKRHTSSMLALAQTSAVFIFVPPDSCLHEDSHLTATLLVSSHLSQEPANVCRWYCVLVSLYCLILHLGSLGNSTKFWWFYYSTK